MSQQTPTAYAPFPASSSSAFAPTRAAISAMPVPFPQNGLSVFCAEAGFVGPYYFCLNPGLAVNGTTVLATLAGGESRWVSPLASIVSPLIVPVASAIVTDAGAYVNESGFAAGIVHAVAGKYTLTLDAPLAIARRIVLATAKFTTGDTSRICVVEDIDDSSFVIQTWNNVAPVLQDSNFAVAVFSQP